jgi:3-deoxy-7-phosphoheptulonate synthase
MTAAIGSRAWWRELPARQQPEWPDLGALWAAQRELARRRGLVSKAQTLRLRERLALVQAGKAFVLQGGDCAEPLTVDPLAVEARLRVFLQMNVVLMHGMGLPIVKILRAAGQFGKPRSANLETVDGLTLPVFRGPIVNAPEFTLAARRPDPERLLRAYDSAQDTIGLIRTLVEDGFADLHQVHAWNMQFADTVFGKRYEELAREIDRALKFARAMGIDTNAEDFRVPELFYSHEALLLDAYEGPLTHELAPGEWVDLSGNMVWIGERTRQLDHAHVAFFERILNPIGVKLGPTTTPEEALELCRRLNPDNVPGRLTFVIRMGADKILDVLPPIMREIEATGCAVVWVTDPMHANTEEHETPHGPVKTRRFERIRGEVEGFIQVCQSLKAHPGGLHLELTGENVTECLGGEVLTGAHLSECYQTLCDPRLNGAQSLALAFEVAEMLRQK